MTEIGTHYRPEDGDYQPGVYRVVGTSEPVSLLRVSDGDGRREATGEVVSVSESALEADFEPAENPDGDLNPVRAIQNLVTGLYWSVRRFLP
jgi:hypothetical protein